MRNAGLEETDMRIKIAGRKINNLRYADDTTLMAENEEDLKNLLKLKKRVQKSICYSTLRRPKSCQLVT